MNIARRQVYRFALGFAAALVLTAPARAQTGDWPNRPIKLMVPFLPGTSPDVIARTLTDAMSQILKQAIVIENRPGAAGNLGAQTAARAAPDGYTWLYAASPLATSMRMYKNPGFDVLKDFTMVGRMTITDLLVIAPVDAGLRTVGDLLERARKNPGKLNFASGGVGSPAHMGAELMLSVGGATATHVPFKGASESLNAVVGKQVDFALTITSVSLAQWKAGKVAVLGITSGKRNPAAPQVPTLIEQGLSGVEVVSFGGLAVPTGTPPAIVKRINEVMREALARSEVNAKLTAQGALPAPSSPEEHTEFMRAEIALTEKMMKAARLEAQ
ncbi:MAG: Bug family tripartite tricarboxylate transporter substrate binding protein [Burkholderiales bacterium]